MTDIKQAIADLRDAINGGEGWPTIHRAYEALEEAVFGKYGVNHPIDNLHVLEGHLRSTSDWSAINRDIDTLESSLASSVEGGTVEPIGYALRCDIDIENDIWECVLSNREDAEVRREELQRTTGFKFDILSLYATPTPSLTARIAAAAEEIATAIDDYDNDSVNWRMRFLSHESLSTLVQNTSTPDVSEWLTANPRPQKPDITAILTRHIQGGK